MADLKRWFPKAGLSAVAVLLSFAPGLFAGIKKAALPAAQRALPARDLYVSERTDLSALSPAVVTSGTKCDAAGDIYALYSGSAAVLSLPGSTSRVPVSKISIQTKEVTQYPLPALSGYGNLFRFSYDVDADGTLYALINAARQRPQGKPKPAWLIVKYNGDGTVDSHFRVGNEPGKQLQPLRIAVFGDGDFLLSGTTVLTKGLGTFSGIFDRQGTFTTPLKFGEAILRTNEPPGGAGTGARAAKKAGASAGKRREVSGPGTADGSPISLESSTLSFSSQDGNVYVLQGTSAATLYVVAPTGEILRRFNLKPPKPGMTPLQMAAAGVGYLFIYYGRVATGAPGEDIHERGIIAVLSSETGRVTAVYRMPEAKVGFVVPACADSPDDFLFLGTSKDNHLEVVRYAAR